MLLPNILHICPEGHKLIREVHISVRWNLPRIDIKGSNSGLLESGNIETLTGAIKGGNAK